MVSVNSSPAGSPADVALDVVRALDEQDRGRVEALVDAAAAADGVRPLNEAVMLALRYGADAVRHVVARATDGTWVGYGHLDLTDRIQGASAEVVVHPQWRRRGIGRALVQRMLDEAAPSTLRLWAHGHHPAAERLAKTLGFSRVRDLWQMRRSLHAELLPVHVPTGVTLRAFRPGTADEEALLRVNARAFAQHAEQGAMSADDLHHRMGEAWFDPQGLIVAEHDAAMVGFHWTKVHAGGEHDPIGEVYVVGVHPDAQGLGLGKVLTLAGLWHLRERGLDQVMLYVESDNAPAIAVYERLGFSRWDVDVMYSR